ncbi:hypothetical protein [Pseudonocardia nigra]|nr:hypothetical protein [Pseudonocardia nigra]
MTIEYTLPDLLYDYGALAPHIATATTVQGSGWAVLGWDRRTPHGHRS